MSGSTDLLQQLLQSGVLQQSAFTMQSRYYGLTVASLPAANGDTISYVTRRFIPQPQNYAVMQRHRVVQGERVDVIAAQSYGDSLYYWRLCDANLATRPEDVTATVGAFINISLPPGIPGG